MNPEETNTVATPIAATPAKNRNTGMFVSVVLAVLVLAGAGYYALQGQKGDVVAIVNGEKIYQTDLEKNMRGIEESARAQGIDVTDASVQSEIRNQALQILIDNTLLLSAAHAAEAEATDEEISLKYEELVTQMGGEEALLAEIEKVGVTKTELEKNIYERVLVDNYLELTTDIEEVTVTDEEVTQYLSTFAGQELPPLEEIKPEVIGILTSQKQQTILMGVMEKLRAEATIEKKI